MDNALLPATLDNRYRGHVLGLWLFGLVLFVRTGIAAGSAFNGRTAAGTADGLPLDVYGPAGAQAVIAMFAAWGVAHLFLNALGALVLVRYRALVPLYFTLLLAEHLARRVVFTLIPVASSEGFSLIGPVLLGATILGVVLSFVPRSRRTVLSEA